MPTTRSIRRRRTTKRKGGKRRSLTGKLLCTPEFFVPSFERHVKSAKRGNSRNSGKKTTRTRSHCRMSSKSKMKSKIAGRTDIVQNVTSGGVRRRKRRSRKTRRQRN